MGFSFCRRKNWKDKYSKNDEIRWNMKVLLTGSNGQLGRELTRQLEKKKIDHVGYDIPEFDVTDKEKIAAIIAKEQPTVIINCGALTNVDGCET